MQEKIHKVEHLKRRKEQIAYHLFEGKSGLVGLLIGLLRLGRRRKGDFRGLARLVGYCVLRRIDLR